MLFIQMNPFRCMRDHRWNIIASRKNYDIDLRIYFCYVFMSKAGISSQDERINLLPGGYKIVLTLNVMQMLDPLLTTG